jgi:DNA modification methylase
MRGCPEGSGSNVAGSVPWEGARANKRSVWTVTTQPFKEAHFAVFPPKLITDCIKAGCPEDGLVLDPFGGSGTTAIVTQKLYRRYILFEMNPAYVDIARKRILNEVGPLALL